VVREWWWQQGEDWGIHGRGAGRIADAMAVYVAEDVYNMWLVAATRRYRYVICYNWAQEQQLMAACGYNVEDVCCRSQSDLLAMSRNNKQLMLLAAKVTPLHQF
jgi:hypothetical protein